MRRPRYRVLTHAADVRVAIWGDDEEELLGNAVLAVTRVVMGRPLALVANATATLSDWPADPEGRLVRAINEAVFQLLHRRRAATGLHGAGTAPRLELAPLPIGAQPEVEVKAATYHDLRVRVRGGRLAAVVTLDL